VCGWSYKWRHVGNVHFWNVLPKRKFKSEFALYLIEILEAPNSIPSATPNFLTNGMSGTGALSLLRINEELFERKNSGSGLEGRDQQPWENATPLYLQNLALQIADQRQSLNR
jgi:hypothetical protein